MAFSLRLVGTSKAESERHLALASLSPATETAARMPDLFPGTTAQRLRQAASQFRRSVTNLEAQGAGIEQQQQQQQQQQQPALQQHRRVASQPELQLLAQHHNVQWDATGSECSATSTSTAGSSSLDFKERCSAAVAKGLGPRAEAERFVADGSFDWELYNWVFMRALDQRLAAQGMQQRSACTPAVLELSLMALALLSAS